jgi:hypothetical protein
MVKKDHSGFKSFSFSGAGNIKLPLTYGEIDFMRKKIIRNLILICFILLGISQGWRLFSFSFQSEALDEATVDDLIFLHHSVGRNWLNHSLHNALLAKDFINERNDIYYGTDLNPDTGRPDSLAPTPGDLTNMNHWILWFNDYLHHVINHDCNTGINRIIMFKSCYPISNIDSDGTEPGDPFSSAKTLTNYKSVYRHPNEPGHTYSHSGYTYKPLFQVFSENPDILFIPVTAPPQHYTATTDEKAHRARMFNNWLKNEALDTYNTMYPGRNNVAVFDLFDVLAYPDDHTTHPNRLRAEYGGASGNSHPNDAGNAEATRVFATNSNNFINEAWSDFQGLSIFIDIKANGSDGPLYLNEGNVLSLSLNFEPGSSIGQNADCWILVKTSYSPPNRWYHYDMTTRTWEPGVMATYQDALFDLEPKEIPITSGLPIGSYEFIFGVDLNMNGSVDKAQAYFDKVQVIINP